MASPKASTNTNVPAQPVTLTLSIEERIEFFANIIVDRIMDDQANGQKLLKRIGDTHDAGTIAPA